jgi:redox-sensitive bicupin YhaK (pirin superfamily)
MSDMQSHPKEIVVDAKSAADDAAVTVIEPRLVPLGGVRAMTVRRTIPHRLRRTIGAWCFLDHYGPNDVNPGDGMLVPPHPHTGLQTVSWLFRGEIEHRDSIGSHQLVTPGEMNLMTAGYGISHSEVSTATDSVLHGVQLWVVLPKAHRNTNAEFSHSVAKTIELDAGSARARGLVFIGELAGVRADVQGFSALVGAELVIPAGGEFVLDADPTFEYGVLLDIGELWLNDEPVGLHALGVLDVGQQSIRLRAGSSDTRLLLIGGEPLNEPFVMWWNFIGDTHDDVVAAREAWMADIIERQAPDFGLAPETGRDARFVDVPGYNGPALPAPTMPNTRLKPR